MIEIIMKLCTHGSTRVYNFIIISITQNLFYSYGTVRYIYYLFQNVMALRCTALHCTATQYILGGVANPKNSNAPNLFVFRCTRGVHANARFGFLDPVPSLFPSFDSSQSLRCSVDYNQ